MVSIHWWLIILFGVTTSLSAAALYLLRRLRSLPLRLFIAIVAGFFADFAIRAVISMGMWSSARWSDYAEWMYHDLFGLDTLFARMIYPDYVAFPDLLVAPLPPAYDAAARAAQFLPIVFWTLFFGTVCFFIARKRSNQAL